MAKTVKIVMFAVLLSITTTSLRVGAMQKVFHSCLLNCFGIIGLDFFYNYRLTADERAFLQAAEDGDVSQLKKLLVKGVAIDVQNTSGNTALHLAALHGRKTVLKFLIANGANIQEKNKNGSTPLHLAAIVFDEDAVKYLVSKGASVTVKDNVKKTPRQVTKYAPVLNYFVLVTDFYRVVNGTFTFVDFAKSYFEVPGKRDAKSNFVSVCRLLSLGSKELADQFYAWNNTFKVKQRWLEHKSFMYLDLMQQASDFNRKLYWRKICLSEPHNWAFNKQAICREFDKPCNARFKKQCAQEFYSNNMQQVPAKVANRAVTKTGISFIPCDLTINFVK